MMRIMKWRVRGRSAAPPPGSGRAALSGSPLSSKSRARAVHKIGAVASLCVVGVMCHVLTGRPLGQLTEAFFGSPGPSPHIGTGANEPRRLAGCLTAEEQKEQDDIRLYMVNKNDLTTSCTLKDSVCLKKGREWMVILCIAGVFYMFVALAIVCDEFFVPSLECFVEEWNISMDVAGATFMAAGGSMPELFTSFIGTFTKSPIGFAAIIGSAVFNVLFVIGVCAVASTEVLKLTWWPLARDCFFYVIGLSVLFVFLEISSEEDPAGKMVGKIQAWQAVVLLCMYVGYCVFMKFSSQAEAFVKTKILKQEIQVADELSAEDNSNKANAHFLMPSSFRMGIVHILAYNQHPVETAGVAAVTQIQGNMKETFEKVDKNKNGVITDDEMRELLGTLGMKPDSDTATDAIRKLDRQKTGVITFEEFSKWYMASEARVNLAARSVFDKFDQNQDGFIGRNEIREVLKSMEFSPSDEDLDRTFKSISTLAGGDVETGKLEGDAQNPNAEERVTFDQFEKWYNTSLLWQNHAKDADEEEQGFHIECPEDATLIQLGWYVLSYPLCAMMYISMPDIRRPKNEGNVKLAIVEFCMSLCWIAFFSFCLVDWLTVASNTLGIPTPVSGVTLLAAGTSIPDLISSYIVAKQGQGDMAVSSSIGSNIFDILVGLPLPWLCYSLIFSESVEVGTQSLKLSILLLIVMLISVITAVMCMHWRMTRCLGYVMFGLYFFFMIQALVRQLPDEENPWVKIPNW